MYLGKTCPHLEIDSQTRLLEFQVWLRTLNLYEVHQSSLLGSLEKVRHKSDPADVVACKHASISTDWPAPVLCSFRWKPSEMPGH